MSDPAFRKFDTASVFSQIERYVVITYNRTSNLDNVNDARLELFTMNGRNIENIPPTQAALNQQVLRTSFQSGVWVKAIEYEQRIPSPDGWGWKLEDSNLIPLWTTLPKAANTMHRFNTVYMYVKGRM